jgi:oxoglutarate/iron-dependent dioxygenase-like protein
MLILHLRQIVGDAALRRLRELGDSADFNRLTACDHNLVRMWAQP